MSREPYRRFLSSLAESEELTEDAITLLAPLVAYDREHHGDLVGTLAMYFTLGLNASKTAETLFLHRNGLAYRLSRAEELLRARLDDPDVRLALQVALRIRAGHSGQETG